MTEKDLKKMSRTELLEILVEQGEQMEALQTRLAEAEKALYDKRLTISNVGSIAEASLRLNGVFEAAENAAKQYIENVQQLSLEQVEACERREAESREKARQILDEAQAERLKILEEAHVEAKTRADNVSDKIASLRSAFEALLSFSKDDGYGAGQDNNNHSDNGSSGSETPSGT